MNRPRLDERGFSLVELLIVSILGLVVMFAVYEILLVNQRTYRQQSAHTQNLQTLRAGMDVLFGELREVSPGDNDLVTLNAGDFTAQVMRKFAILCSVDATGANPTVTARKVGSFFENNDQVVVYFDNLPTTANDDVWQGGTVSGVNTTGVTCADGSEAQQITIQGLPNGITGVPPDQVQTGAFIRGFETYTYDLQTFDGETYLARQAAGSTDWTPLVGPLASSNGVTFTYLDVNGNVTATPASVAQIEVTLRTESDVRDESGDLIRDSLKVRIFARN